MRPKNKTTAAAVARAALMPPLLHTLPGQEFDVMRSQVVQWMCHQPELRQRLFDSLRNSGAIVFRNGHWQGVHYAP